MDRRHAARSCVIKSDKIWQAVLTSRVDARIFWCELEQAGCSNGDVSCCAKVRH